MMVGQGARGAVAEVVEVAERLGAGVSKALLGKDVLDDDRPFVTGCNGLLGTRPSYELMRDCDTLLMVGSSFPYSQFLPEYGQARAPRLRTRRMFAWSSHSASWVLKSAGEMNERPGRNEVSR